MPTAIRQSTPRSLSARRRAALDARSVPQQYKGSKGHWRRFALTLPALTLAALASLPVHSLAAQSAENSAFHPAGRQAALVGAGITRQDAVTPQSPPSRQQTNTSTLIDPTPFVSRALGLELHPPRGARIEAQQSGERTSILIAEDSDNPRWSMRLQTLVSGLTEPTPEREIDDHLRLLEARGAEFRIIERRTLEIDGKEAHQCYIEQVAANREPYVAGWLIITTGPGTYLAISSITLPEYLPDVQPVLDACFATVRLLTVEEQNRETMLKMVNGQAMLQQINETRLRSQLGTELNLRTYIPESRSPSGQELEIGWATIRMVEAKRGTVNPNRSEFDYDLTEHEIGFVVHVQAHMIERHSQPRITSDIEAVYWLAWDLTSEQWSVRATRRQGEASVTTAETGILIPATTGQPRPVLIVAKPGPGREAPSEWTVPEVYLPQALRWVMPRLLPRDTDQPREFGWYAYDHTAAQPAFSRRVDRWDPGRDHWKLTTWFSIAGEPTVSEYKPDGALIRQLLPSGAVTEAMSLEAIHRIWESKGLLTRQPTTSEPRRNEPGRVGR